VVGAVGLGTEIGVARLLAPFFGESTFVWANTIATVLLALACGYWVGGRLADRRPDLRTLCTVIAIGAGLLALVPIVATPLLRLASTALSGVSAGAFIGSLIGVMALVFVPVCLFGAATPFLLRLSLSGISGSGRTSGRIYAISTLGSLTGTFLSALLLVPLIGTRRTFFALSFCLALVALSGLPRRVVVLPLSIALAGVFFSGAIKPAPAGEKLVYETETPYQYARVVERAGGERLLELDEGQAVHSIYRPGTLLTGGYWDDALVLPFAARATPPGRIAILGDAAGSMARAYGHFFPATRIDAVEIDSRLTAIGRDYFHLRAPHLHTITADARAFIREPGPRYGAVVLDAYRQPYIPFYLTTREFFEEVRERMSANGVFLVNVGHPEGSDDLEHVLTATLKAVFPDVRRAPFDSTNTWLIAAPTPPRPARVLAARWLLPHPLDSVAREAASRIAAPLPGGTVYTDDHAPVEWLIDRSLFDYAEGKR
jgi:spermidine synthase